MSSKSIAGETIDQRPYSQSRLSASGCAPRSIRSKVERVVSARARLLAECFKAYAARDGTRESNCRLIRMVITGKFNRINSRADASPELSPTARDRAGLGDPVSHRSPILAAPQIGVSETRGTIVQRPVARCYL